MRSKTWLETKLKSQHCGVYMSNLKLIGIFFIIFTFDLVIERIRAKVGLTESSLPFLPIMFYRFSYRCHSFHFPWNIQYLTLMFVLIASVSYFLGALNLSKVIIREYGKHRFFLILLIIGIVSYLVYRILLPNTQTITNIPQKMNASNLIFWVCYLVPYHGKNHLINRISKFFNFRSKPKRFFFIAFYFIFLYSYVPIKFPYFVRLVLIGEVLVRYKDINWFQFTIISNVINSNDLNAQEM